MKVGPNVKCDFCGSPAEEARFFDCLALAFCGRCLWARTVPQRVKEKLAREKGEDVKSYSNVRPGKEKKEFNETLKLAVGQAAVFQAMERREVQTQYGLRVVYDVRLKGSPEGKFHSIFWPFRCPEPPVMQPVRLTRVKEKESLLEVPENDDERNVLWGNG